VRGKTIIITGSTSGIGFETARVLATNGANLILPARDERKSADTIRRLRELSGNNNIEGGTLELGSLKSVAAFANAFLATNRPLHILINNAGVMSCPYGKTTDGFDTQVGTNHFGHFYLTTLLLPALRRSAPARVINLSSSMHRFVCIFLPLDRSTNHLTPPLIMVINRVVPFDSIG
jgi:NAD(P)-dependent dehydrogenase (short-subunit alcohol dehydrogenase family)